MGRTAAVVFFLLAFSLFVSLSVRIWSPQRVYDAIPPGVVPLQGPYNVHNGTIQRLDFQSENMPAFFEKMRREALDDKKAIYLSKEVTPPFDPSFRNPCWYYGKYNDSLACLPYVYLGGFPKSGTTDLFSRLLQHPYVTGGLVKEPHCVTRSYFAGRRPLCDRDMFNRTDYSSCSMMAYAKRFFNPAANKIITIKSGDNDQMRWKTIKYPAITVDASASTAWDNSNGYHIIRDIVLPDHVRRSEAAIIDWLVKVNPNVRFILIMREPASRVYSDYNFFHGNTSPNVFDSHVDAFIQTFQQCMTSRKSDIACARSVHSSRSVVRMHIGLYYVYLKELLLRIPRERIHFIRTEDYHNDMAHELRRLFDFLQIPQASESTLNEIIHSTEKNVNHRKVEPMHQTTWAKLAKFYQPFNEKLAKLLQNDSYLWQDVYSKFQL